MMREWDGDGDSVTGDGMGMGCECDGVDGFKTCGMDGGGVKSHPRAALYFKSAGNVSQEGWSLPPRPLHPPMSLFAHSCQASTRTETQPH